MSFLELTEVTRLYLAKGGDLRKMIAELYGKVDWLRQGQGRIDAFDRRCELE